ncbi:hypothetical protein TUBRATIS_12800 [Tubulinosema ratisbonensis]|uniref:Uncharacterized protein n=1 Tax=Tubulinosema ratisbonensis TaxID=291195 RepID=A0A437AM30_9MICR|nr:hypothetical protein TUBRATIS_12800 [Tubulinosema ratisbonensis]
MLKTKSLITKLCSKQQISSDPFTLLSEKLIFLQNNLISSQKNYYISNYLSEQLINFYKSILKISSQEKLYILLESFLNRKDIKEIYDYFYYFTCSDLIIKLFNESITKSVELWMIYGCYKNNTIVKKRELDFGDCALEHKFLVDKLVPDEYKEMILKGGVFIYFTKRFFGNKMNFDTKEYNFTNFNDIYNIYQKNYLTFNNLFFTEIKKEVNLVKKYILMSDESKISEFLINKHDYPFKIIKEESLTSFLNLESTFSYEFDDISLELDFPFLKIFLSKSNLKELKIIFRILLLLHYTKRKCDRINSFIIEQFINEINFKTEQDCCDVFMLISDLKEKINFVLRVFLVLSNKFELILRMIGLILEKKDLCEVTCLVGKEDLSLGLKIFFEEFDYKEYCRGDV